jgi:hypothetical protein
LSDLVSYQCPFCDKTTVGDRWDVESEALHNLNLRNRVFLLGLLTKFSVCANCHEYSLVVTLHRTTPDGAITGPLIQQWELVPPSRARVFPDYVPDAIRRDYKEACLIASPSPKGAAALARRCLQGMIRDFWGIKRDRLVDEIKAVKDHVDPLIWQAIDAVRTVGNIGAHMEKDVNLIIDITAEETSKLIWLIEFLVEQWYVVRHQREERLKQVAELANEKRQRKGSTPPPPEEA